MDKLKLAHDWALVFMQHNKDLSVAAKTVSAWAFDYADAMQAEAEKRNKAEAEQKRKEIREILNDANTFIEREGQHFDDVEEWQPDWSQAPEWATHFFCERDDDDRLNGYFAEDKRGISINSDISGFDGYGRVCSCETFGYQGDWKESLRRRPHGF